MSAVAVADLGLRFGATVALEDVTFSLDRGSVLAVLGPSGCGKSSLLRCIAGLEPYSGSVRLGDRLVDGVPPHRRNLGLMFQDHALFAHRDVAGNVGFGLEVAGVGRPARDERVASLLDLVGLGGFEQRSTGSLSGGEAQRVALARALAPGPDLLLLDEPLASLDRPRRDDLLGQLHSILRGVGQTAVYVTHERDEAFAVADQIAIMREGRLVRVGTPAAVWNDPQTVFVAQFLGQPNVLRLPTGPSHRWASVPPDAIGGTAEGATVTFRGTVAEHRFRGDHYDETVVDAEGRRLVHHVDQPHALGGKVALVIDARRCAWLSDDAPTISP